MPEATTWHTGEVRMAVVAPITPSTSKHYHVPTSSRIQWLPPQKKQQKTLGSKAKLPAVLAACSSCLFPLSGHAGPLAAKQSDNPP